MIELIEPLFAGYYPGYMAAAQTLTVGDLPEFGHIRKSVLFMAYDPELRLRDWAEHDRERRVADFCARGNGLVLAGAYWTQYLDMRVVAPYGAAVRRHLPLRRQDGCAARREHMRAQPAGSLRIGVHVRRRDYKDYHGGIYYFEFSEYAAIMRHISGSLGAAPHTFYLCSDEACDRAAFEGLPVMYAQSAAFDDFVALASCRYVVGPPSTFSTGAAFLGGARRLVLTRERVAHPESIWPPLDHAVDIPFPTGAYLPGDPDGPADLTARPI